MNLLIFRAALLLFRLFYLLVLLVFRCTQSPNHACFEIEPIFYSKLYGILDLPWFISWYFVSGLVLVRTERCPVFIRDGAFSVQSSMEFLNCHGLFIDTSCLVQVRTELCSVVIRNGTVPFFLFETLWDSWIVMVCVLVLRALFWLGQNYARLFETEPF